MAVRYSLGALLVVALLTGLWIWQTRGHQASPAPPVVAPVTTTPVVTAPPATEPQPSPPAPPPPPPAPAPLPAPSVSVSPASIHPGDVAVISIAGEGLTGATATVTGLNQQPRFVAVDGRLVALVAVPADVDAGGYPLGIRWQRGADVAPAGREGAWEGTLRVAAKQFVEDRMTATKEQNDIRTDPRQGQDAERVARIRSHWAPAPLWSGAFLWPVRGEVSTEFGAIRYVNGEYTGQHMGLDIESKQGTPVLATAAGKVVLAESLIITGNTVIVDHGMGLFSLYAHMSSLSVKVGDSVAHGGVLGKVGSTGWSTSPHLHWTMTVGNVSVDPRLFADKTLMDR